MQSLVARGPLVAGARTSRAFRPVAHTIANRRHIRRVAAVEEQETTYQAAAAHQQPSPEGVPDNEALQEYELEDLDQSQEELLKWMLYLDKQEQQADLDEMVDYDEFGDEEFAEIAEDVEEMIEENTYSYKPGDKVVGTVYEVDEDGAYIEIGAKSAGFVPLSECSMAKLKSPLEVLRPGMQREFIVVEEEDEYGEIILSLAAIEAQVFWTRLRQLQAEDVAMTVRVTAANRGGLLCQFHHIEGFIPSSHFGQSITVETMEDFVGAELTVKLLEVDEEKDRLVFSHRRASADGDARAVQIGDLVTGVVQSVKPYGAFIDIGGITGLLHISQITNERLLAIDTVLSVGDKLKVLVLSADADRGRVTLSTKKLEKNPGDMLNNPQAVFEGAEEMAAQFRERMAAADTGADVTATTDDYTTLYEETYAEPVPAEQPEAAVAGQQGQPGAAQ